MLQREERCDMDNDAAPEEAVAASALISCKTVTPALTVLRLLNLGFAVQ